MSPMTEESARRSTPGIRGGAMWLVVLASLVAIVGCAGSRPEYAARADLEIEEAPLGGEALAQRKQDLERALHDMIALHGSMASLVDRRDGQGLAVLDTFVGAYLGRHLDPLLASQWQSSHPEVMTLDANLRFIKADVLVQMRYPRAVQSVIDDIASRYRGRSEMLVEYPLGEQNTISDALEILQNRKWEG